MLMNTSNLHTAKFQGENILRLLKNNWLLLLLFSIVGAIGAMSYKLTSTPKYAINGLLQVDNKQFSYQDDSQPDKIFDKNGRISPDSTPLSSIIMVLATSPYILNDVIDNLKLYIEVKPVLFPLVGRHIYYNFQPTIPDELNDKFTNIDLFHLNNYAWGGEYVSVSNFSVPDALLEKPFTILVNANNSYLLFYNEKHIASCQVGQICLNGDGSILLLIDKINARVHTKFTLVRHSQERVYKSLSSSLILNEVNKVQSTTDHSGIINITLSGEQPSTQAKIINGIMEILITRSLMDKKTPLIAMRAFLDANLSQIEGEYVSARRKLSQYRQENKLINMETQSKLLATSLDDINRQISQNAATIKSLENVYGAKHPLMISLRQQANQLQYNKRELLKQMDSLPIINDKSGELENNLKIQQELKDVLLKRNQELQILMSGQISGIRVLSYASSNCALPASSDVKLFTIIGGILGFVLGIFVILIMWVIRPINNPFDLESVCGITVRAIFCYRKFPAKYSKRAIKLKTCEDYQEYSNLFRYSSSHIQTKRIVTEMLLSAEKHKVIGIISFYIKARASLIAHNLAKELSVVGKDVLIIHSLDLNKPHFIPTENLYDNEGNQIGEQYHPYAGVTIYLISPRLRLDVFNQHINQIINKNYTNFDHIFVLDHRLSNNPLRLINFNLCTSMYYVTTQAISRNRIQKDLEYLKQNKIVIDGLLFNYNRRYRIHDAYSK